MTHFAGKNHLTLCGREWTSEVWSNDPKASCTVCQDKHAARGWTFPLPELVAFD